MVEIIKKNLSNILFVIGLGIVFYPPTRVWLIRQFSFSPAIAAQDDQRPLSSYDWQLDGMNATDINLKELEGQVIFLNFWATWCPPCRAEMPMIQSLYNDYKDKVAFVFVSNEDPLKVKAFYEKENYNLPTYRPLTALPATFDDMTTIPTTYIINKKGQIVVEETGAADWNSEKSRKIIDELLAE